MTSSCELLMNSNIGMTYIYIYRIQYDIEFDFIAKMFFFSDMLVNHTGICYVHVCYHFALTVILDCAQMCYV